MAKPRPRPEKSHWGRVRPGAHRIGLLAEGAALFFYDEAPAYLSLWRIKSKTPIEKRFCDTWCAAEVRVGPAPKLSKRLRERLGLP